LAGSGQRGGAADPKSGRSGNPKKMKNSPKYQPEQHPLSSAGAPEGIRRALTETPIKPATNRLVCRPIPPSAAKLEKLPRYPLRPGHKTELAPSLFGSHNTRSASVAANNLVAAARRAALSRKALQIARRQRAKTWELAAAISLAEILNSQGEFEKSALLLRPLYHEFEASNFLKEHLVRAHTLLEECQSGKLRSSITHLRQV
jgi:hypothetical protein